MLQTAFRAIAAVFGLLLNNGERQAFSWYLQSGVRDAARQGTGLPTLTWSQEGEDLLLAEALPDFGTYVDVGAHDPYRFSNTKLLYDRGWRGCNIDFTEGFLQRFAAARPEDCNVRSLVGRPRSATYFRFEEDALNTLDPQRADALREAGWPLIAEEQVHVRSLTEILEEVGFGRSLDLLNVDVEGSDLEVLESLDWERWSVSMVLVEVGEPALRVQNTPIALLLSNQGLHVTRVWGRSCLFERI